MGKAKRNNQHNSRKGKGLTLNTVGKTKGFQKVIASKIEIDRLLKAGLIGLPKDLLSELSQRIQHIWEKNPTGIEELTSRLLHIHEELEILGCRVMDLREYDVKNGRQLGEIILDSINENFEEFLVIGARGFLKKLRLNPDVEVNVGYNEQSEEYSAATIQTLENAFVHYCYPLLDCYLPKEIAQKLLTEAYISDGYCSIEVEEENRNDLIESQEEKMLHINQIYKKLETLSLWQIEDLNKKLDRKIARENGGDLGITNQIVK